MHASIESKTTKRSSTWARQSLPILATRLPNQSVRAGGLDVHQPNDVLSPAVTVWALHKLRGPNLPHAKTHIYTYTYTHTARKRRGAEEKKKKEKHMKTHDKVSGAVSHVKSGTLRLMGLRDLVSCLCVLLSATTVTKSRDGYLEDTSTLGQHPWLSATSASAPLPSAHTDTQKVSVHTVRLIVQIFKEIMRYSKKKKKKRSWEVMRSFISCGYI